MWEHTASRPRQATHPNPTAPWNWPDWACLVFLLLTTIFARYRSLNGIPVNPDEAEYESLATRCHARHVSIFSLPIPYTYTALVYELFAPYGLMHVRFGQCGQTI
jgi:hypothetical protein